MMDSIIDALKSLDSTACCSFPCSLPLYVDGIYWKKRCRMPDGKWNNTNCTYEYHDTRYDLCDMRTTFVIIFHVRGTGTSPSDIIHYTRRSAKSGQSYKHAAGGGRLLQRSFVFPAPQSHSHSIGCDQSPPFFNQPSVSFLTTQVKNKLVRNRRNCDSRETENQSGHLSESSQTHSEKTRLDFFALRGKNQLESKKISVCNLKKKVPHTKRPFCMRGFFFEVANRFFATRTSVLYAGLFF